MKYIGNDPLELIKSAGKQQTQQMMVASSGTVTSVDPVKYMAKVMLEPLGIETGWLPICTPYAGPGFGLVALPDDGLEVIVLFEMGNVNVGKVLLFNFNDMDKPPGGLQAGEAWLVHKSGSTLKFHPDGSIELNPATQLKLAGGGAKVARAGDSVQVNVNGTNYTGIITGGSGKVNAG